MSVSTVSHTIDAAAGAFKQTGEPQIQRSRGSLRPIGKISRKAVSWRCRPLRLIGLQSTFSRLPLRALLLAKPVPTLSMLGCTPLDAVPLNSVQSLKRGLHSDIAVEGSATS